MELNELGDELNDTAMPEPSSEKEAAPDKSFSSGENKVSISNGNFSVEMHCTNTTPEQVADISIWLLNQMKDAKQTKEVSYLQ